MSTFASEFGIDQIYGIDGQTSMYGSIGNSRVVYRAVRKLTTVKPCKQPARKIAA